MTGAPFLLEEGRPWPAAGRRVGCGRAKGRVFQETPHQSPEDTAFPTAATPETKWISSSGSKSNWQLNIYSSYWDLNETCKAAVIITGVKKKSEKQDNPMWSLNVKFLLS